MGKMKNNYSNRKYSTVYTIRHECIQNVMQLLQFRIQFQQTIIDTTNILVLGHKAKNSYEVPNSLYQCYRAEFISQCCKQMKVAYELLRQRDYFMGSSKLQHCTVSQMPFQLQECQLYQLMRSKSAPESTSYPKYIPKGIIEWSNDI